MVRRFQFSVRALLIAVTFFGIGMAVQQWRDQDRINAIAAHEQFVRNYEASLSDNSEQLLAVARGRFNNEMALMSKMLEEAYEGERHARQELVEARKR
jgi:hypothetical protein